MAVRYYSGRDALFIFRPTVATTDDVTGQTAIKATQWSLQAEVGLLSTTTLGDSINSFIPDRVTYTGSATLLYYENDAEGNGDNFTGDIMSRVFKTGTGGVTTSDEAGFMLRIRGGSGVSNDEKHDMTLNGYLTSVSIGATVGDIITAQVSFTASGALIETSMAALT